MTSESSTSPETSSGELNIDPSAQPLPHRRSGRRGASPTGVDGIADLITFEQHVTQADADRDPFGIALFELQPHDQTDPVLVARLCRSLLEFASASTVVAYLGNSRFAMLSRTTDSPSQWVAPAATALRAELDRWNASRPTPSPTVADLDVSDLTDELVLVAGAARGLSAEVWSNADVAIARAREQRIPFYEYRSRKQAVVDARPQSESESAVAIVEPTVARSRADVLADDRLVTVGHRIEPVDRPEPEWHWLRLTPALLTESDIAPYPITMDDLSFDDQALLEIWLAGQMGPLFETTDQQLRVTIPITGEASRSRSFAQRIFPLMERHRIPPTRVVIEIDSRVLVQDMLSTGPQNRADGSPPPVRRFVEDAVAMNVAVTVSRFDGGWNAWRAIDGLGVSYIKPGADIVRHAGQGDNGATRALVLLGSEADARSIELIVPDVATELSPEALAQIGFDYSESRAQPVSASDHAAAVAAAASYGSSSTPA